MSAPYGFRALGQASLLGALGLLLAPHARGQVPAPVAAPSVEQNLERMKACVADHEESQVRRNEGDLLGARSALLACSQAACPAIVRTDCLQWFDEVERDLPSIVVSVRAGANDVDAVLSVDGVNQPPDIYGKALQLNPGRHHFRIEPSGAPAQERDLVLGPRDKDRTLSFEIEVAAAAAPPSAPATPHTSIPTQRPVPLLSWVLGGASLTLAGGGGVLGTLALSERVNLKKPAAEGGCSPYCSDKEVASTRRQAVAADVLFGLSLATGAAALITYLWRPAVPLQRARATPTFELGGGATPSAGLLGVRGQF